MAFHRPGTAQTSLTEVIEVARVIAFINNEQTGLRAGFHERLALVMLEPTGPAKECTALKDKARDTTPSRDEYIVLMGRLRLPVHIFYRSVLSITERTSNCVVKADVRIACDEGGAMEFFNRFFRELT